MSSEPCSKTAAAMKDKLETNELKRFKGGASTKAHMCLNSTMAKYSMSDFKRQKSVSQEQRGLSKRLFWTIDLDLAHVQKKMTAL